MQVPRRFCRCHTAVHCRRRQGNAAARQTQGQQRRRWRARAPGQGRPRGAAARLQRPLLCVPRPEVHGHYEGPSSFFFPFSFFSSRGPRQFSREQRAAPASAARLRTQLESVALIRWPADLLPCCAPCRSASRSGAALSRTVSPRAPPTSSASPARPLRTLPTSCTPALTAGERRALCALHLN